LRTTGRALSALALTVALAGTAAAEDQPKPPAPSPAAAVSLEVSLTPDYTEGKYGTRHTTQILRVPLTVDWFVTDRLDFALTVTLPSARRPATCSSRGEPGFGISACEYLAARDIALTMCDTSACDAQPSGEQGPDFAVPCHTEMQTRRGIWNLENVDTKSLVDKKDPRGRVHLGAAADH